MGEVDRNLEAQRTLVGKRSRDGNMRRDTDRAVLLGGEQGLPQGVSEDGDRVEEDNSTILGDGHRPREEGGCLGEEVLPVGDREEGPEPEEADLKGEVLEEGDLKEEVLMVEAREEEGQEVELKEEVTVGEGQLMGAGAWDNLVVVLVYYSF